MKKLSIELMNATLDENKELRDKFIDWTKGGNLSKADKRDILKAIKERREYWLGMSKRDGLSASVILDFKEMVELYLDLQQEFTFEYVLRRF